MTIEEKIQAYLAAKFKRDQENTRRAMERRNHMLGIHSLVKNGPVEEKLNADL